ncbi:MAG: hypothetical protein ACR2MT_10680 [Aurantibacter sp.]
MKNTTTLFLLFFLLNASLASAQDEEPVEKEDYVEFNDRKNVVHGVYLGLALHYGEIKGKSTYMTNLKLAYVANQQFEVGLGMVGFYSEQDLTGNFTANEDLIGGYVGLHLEPILFSKSMLNLSFPVLIGAGAVGYVDGDIVDEQDIEVETSDALFVFEPGVNLLFNVNRYLQIEAGARYRFSGTIELSPSPLKRINGFSAGIGIKVGVFNLGRNRYKKNIQDEE